MLARKKKKCILLRRTNNYYFSLPFPPHFLPTFLERTNYVGLLLSSGATLGCYDLNILRDCYHLGNLV